MAVHQAIDLAYGFGILGNVVSFLVYLAPVPTFYRIYKKKSTEEFQALPYSVSLFSAMLYLYYAFLKGNTLVLVTINSVGCVTEILYLTIFLIYATKKSRVRIANMLLFFNVALLGFIIVSTYYLAKGHQRVQAIGWICAVFSLSVFAAPLSIMRKVIRTRSVEFMPLSLSFFLTICAVVWFFYGFLVKDYYIAGPNILGFVFGVIQMVLYMVYRNKKNPAAAAAESKVHAVTTEIKNNETDHHHQDKQHQELEEIVVVVVDHTQEETVQGIVIERDS